MSFTPFNAPIQQRPAVVKREDVDTGEVMEVVREAFLGDEGLVVRLGGLARSGIFLLSLLGRLCLTSYSYFAVPK